MTGQLVRGMAVLRPPEASRPDVVPLEIRGTQVLVGMTRVPTPVLDPLDPTQEAAVLVRVRAFSTNYRDRWLMRKAAHATGDGQAWVLGSEFAGEVVAVGPGASTVRPGQRVMADNHWAGQSRRSPGGSRAGVPTNNASREYLLLSEDQLYPVPDGMSWAEAAAFSIGAQTSLSMARKAITRPGDRVIVTAGRSSTSLFLVLALVAQGAKVWVITSSEDVTDRLTALGAEDVVVWSRDDEAVPAGLKRAAPFDAVVDPFFDVYATRTLPLLRPDTGRYVWCGFTDTVPPSATLQRASETAATMGMLRNLTLAGNCIGHTSDLAEGVRLWHEGRLTAPIDTVFTSDHPAAFVRRTFLDPHRIGKTVFVYDSQI